MKHELFKEKKFIGLKLVFELVVIFLGVYLAFLMDDYRENKVKDERRSQISKALHEEIDYCLKGAEKNMPYLSSAFQRWLDQYESGKKPIPFTFNTTGIDLPPRSMWEATLASGGLNILRVETLKVLSHYYNGLNELLQEFKEIHRYAVSNIGPHLANPDYFYAANSFKLKPEFEWQVNRMKNLIKNSESLITLGEKAKTLLEKDLPEPEPEPAVKSK